MRSRPTLEQLEDRCVPSASAVFNAATGVLTVQGTSQNDSFLAYADAAAQVHVSDNGIDLAIQGGAPTRAQVMRIDMYGNNGRDVFATDPSLDTRDAAGVLKFSPATRFYGGRGDDVFKPRNGGVVNGAAGIVNGVVQQTTGDNYSDGGAGNDMFFSGLGNDVFLGRNGNDTYVWPPGTLTDYFNGGSGKDSALVVDGGAGNYTVRGQVPGYVDIHRVTGVQFDVFLEQVESFQIQTAGTVTTL